MKKYKRQDDGESSGKKSGCGSMQEIFSNGVMNQNNFMAMNM